MVKYSSCLSSIFFRDLLNPVKYVTVSFNLPSIAFFPVPCKIKIAFQIFLRIAIQDQRSVVLSYDKVWDAFRWKQGIRSVFRKIQKIRTLLLSGRVRILLLWCTSRDSDPGPTDQEKPTWNNRQFSKLRRFVVFIVLSWICVLHLLHPLHLLSPLASVIQLFRCAKSVQKCAESKSAP